MTVPDDVRPAPDTDSGGQTSEGEAASSASYEAAFPGESADVATEPPPVAPPGVSAAAAPEAPADTALLGSTTELPEPTPDPHGDAGPQDVNAPAWYPFRPADSGMPDDEQATEASPLAPSSDGWAEVTTEATSGPAEEPTAAEPVGPDALPASALAEVQAALTSLGSKVDGLAATTAELARLRTRDTDLISRLHDDVTKLRTGELAAALNPVVAGMIKLHDQMVSLGALTDPASPVGMLDTQLLQTMELTCGVKPFSPERGDRFDASRHTGTRRIATTDTSADGTIADTIKAGFVRGDGSVVRVAEVEVHRLSV